MRYNTQRIPLVGIDMSVGVSSQAPLSISVQHSDVPEDASTSPERLPYALAVQSSMRRSPSLE